MDGGVGGVSGLTREQVSTWRGTREEGGSLCQCEDVLFKVQLTYTTNDILIIRGCSTYGSSIPVRVRVKEEWYLLRSYVICPKSIQNVAHLGVQTYLVRLDESFMVFTRAMTD